MELPSSFIVSLLVLRSVIHHWIFPFIIRVLIFSLIWPFQYWVDSIMSRSYKLYLMSFSSSFIRDEHLQSLQWMASVGDLCAIEEMVARCVTLGVGWCVGLASLGVFDWYISSLGVFAWLVGLASFSLIQWRVGEGGSGSWAKKGGRTRSHARCVWSHFYGDNRTSLWRVVRWSLRTYTVFGENDCNGLNGHQGLV